MRTHDPTWEPDPNVYATNNLLILTKPKRRSVENTTLKERNAKLRMRTMSKSLRNR